MKKIFLLIAVCLLINVSANSQNVYPAIIEFNGDTVVAITIPQMDTISERLDDVERCSLADSLIDLKSQENRVCGQLVSILKVQAKSYQSEINDLHTLTDIQGQILANKDAIISEQKRKNRNGLLIGVPVSFAIGSAVGMLVGLFGVR